MLSSDWSNAYAAMLNKLEEIEFALDQHDTAPITHFAQEIDGHLEEIMLLDSQRTIPGNDSHRLTLEMLLKRNMAVIARIQEIMALQRIELTHIKRGRETAKGYASYRFNQAGAIINSSN